MITIFENNSILINLKEKGVILPTDEKMGGLLESIAKYYEEFESEGEFYSYKSNEEFGRTYHHIFKTDNPSTELVIVKDWLEELTGSYGSWYTPESYGNIIEGCVEEFLYDSLIELNNIDGDEFEEKIGESVYSLTLELLAEIEDLTIEQLKKYLNG
ncbi:hypothetical protein [Bacillus manliponensis]|uniref:hypothetical protein n=1 Tax=Bacillus manliponensis TaxID=574376 RepID=UPI003512AC8D